MRREHEHDRRQEEQEGGRHSHETEDAVFANKVNHGRLFP
jgi:hypothetical protein